MFLGQVHMMLRGRKQESACCALLFLSGCLPLAISSYQQGSPVQLSQKDYKSDLQLPSVSNILFSFAGWNLWSYWQRQVIPVFGILQNGGHI